MTHGTLTSVRCIEELKTPPGVHAVMESTRFNPHG